MTKRRFHAPGYSVSTRGHSILRRGAYPSPVRSRFASDEFAPVYVPRSLGYDTSAEEYSIGSAVTQAYSFTDGTLYDTYDTANRSRGRDQKLLQDATAAIVSTETHSTPRTSVASRRVARKITTAPPAKPPPPIYPYRNEVVSPFTPTTPAFFSSSRPRPVIVIQALSRLAATGFYQPVYQPYMILPWGPRVRAPQSSVESAPRASSAARGRKRKPVVVRRRTVVSPLAKYVSRPIFAQAPPRYQLYSVQSAIVTYRKPTRRAKAAIVASKVEIEPTRRRRTPRSKFAQDKLRRTRPVSGEESVSAPPPPTTSLHASRPPLPQPTDRRSIRDVDGFTKPRNLLSWQYRLESRADPADLIYKPGSFGRMREQVLDVHDKLDRHRQLLDRYLTDSGPSSDVKGSVLRKMEELERRDPEKASKRGDN